MVKIGRNERCPCGSGKKFKKCCLNKRPQEQVVTIGSMEPLSGIQYNAENKMIFGLTADNRHVELNSIISQKHYVSESNKERIIYRVSNEFITSEADLYRYLSSFDQIIAVDTNTKKFGSNIISASVVLCCRIKERNIIERTIDVKQKGIVLFRDCPQQINEEKVSWLTVINSISNIYENRNRRYALITDHDLGNHDLYNNGRKPIWREFYLPNNIRLVYARSDGPQENLLTFMIKEADKRANSILENIIIGNKKKGGPNEIHVNDIPIPLL